MPTKFEAICQIEASLKQAATSGDLKELKKLLPETGPSVRVEALRQACVNGKGDCALEILQESANRLDSLPMQDCLESAVINSLSSVVVKIVELDVVSDYEKALIDALTWGENKMISVLAPVTDLDGVIDFFSNGSSVDLSENDGLERIERLATYMTSEQREKVLGRFDLPTLRAHHQALNRAEKAASMDSGSSPVARRSVGSRSRP